MEGETIIASNGSGSIKGADETISILVVDDDTTCLSVVAAKLKKFQYEVATVKHPNDALCTLRIKGGAFDLVVSDVHMPDMNGIQLQRAIAREFNLPVVLMSVDGEEGVVLEGLDSGAAFYIVKPVSSDDLNDLWQFAHMKKQKGKVVIEETGEGTSSSSASSVNEAGHDHNKDSERKSPKNKGYSRRKSEESSQHASQKKPKVLWTNALHNKFLEAIRSIGLDRAVPKRILEAMNVPALTRENVASHLQKYRIFLRRVSDEASYRIQCSSDNDGFTSRSFSPSSRSVHSTLLLRRLSTLHNQNPQHVPAGANYSASFLSKEVSRTFTAQSGFGQSRLLSNGGSFVNPSVISTNQTDPSSVRLAQNVHQASTSIQGNHSRGVSGNYDPLVHDSIGLNSETDYELLSYKNFNSSFPTSKNFTFHTNYVGLKISNIKHLLESGKSFKGAINLSSELEYQNSCNVSVAPSPNKSTTNPDQMVRESMTSSSSYSDISLGGDQLWDVLAECQMLPHSNPNDENGGKIQNSAYSSPLFDFDQFTKSPLEECSFNPTFADQVHIQNQVQKSGGDDVTSSNYRYGTRGWDNHVSSSDQGPNEWDEDEFLESLLATGPFEENINPCNV